LNPLVQFRLVTFRITTRRFAGAFTTIPGCAWRAVLPGSPWRTASTTASTPGAACSVTLPVIVTCSANVPDVTIVTIPFWFAPVPPPGPSAPLRVPNTRSPSVSSAVPIFPSPS
jgi:hypothetical protein